MEHGPGGIVAGSGVPTADGMNVDFLIQRLIGRPTCRLQHDAVLGSSARIRNIRGDTEKILVGPHTRILGELLTFAHGGEIKIGEWCYVGEGSRIWSAASIAIGDRVLISHFVKQSVFEPDPA